ncbi:ribosomal-processing cysteine protease Prp [Vagococcus silagei]|uniref:ribosomal-processing cysteine protease Prp n=1 Tax=Vagococcus silagei TaxID=2508885 RepID=UPI001EF5A79E|nr:ribosomal-processing cysteine protease Prp [Vagococcus silagei]
MIRVLFKQDDQGCFQSFELSGHAGSGPYGYDLVCAACSSLSINTVNSIEQLAQTVPIVESDEGYLFLTVPADLSVEQREKVQLLTDSLQIGLRDIAKEYPEFVRFT